jgi:hypothetical protein
LKEGTIISKGSISFLFANILCPLSLCRYLAEGTKEKRIGWPKQ